MSKPFSLGELILIYDAVAKLPIGYRLSAGRMKNGAMYQVATREDLLLKIDEHGECLMQGSVYYERLRNVYTGK